MANTSRGFWWPESFDVEEILPPFNKDQGAPWHMVRLMTKEIAEGLDALRALVNKPLFINTWDMLEPSREKFGLRKQPYTLSGFRSFDTTVGAEYSLHKFMRAFDFKCPSMSVGDLYSKVIHYWREIKELQVFTEIEHIDDTPTWVHLGVANRPGIDSIQIIRPFSNK